MRKNANRYIPLEVYLNMPLLTNGRFLYFSGSKWSIPKALSKPKNLATEYCAYRPGINKEIIIIQ